MDSTVGTIVVDHLRDNGFDGLCNPDLECGCGLDDFTPCDEPSFDCKPAYKGRTPRDLVDVYGDIDFYFKNKADAESSLKGVSE